MGSQILETPQAGGACSNHQDERRSSCGLRSKDRSIWNVFHSCIGSTRCKTKRVYFTMPTRPMTSLHQGKQSLELRKVKANSCHWGGTREASNNHNACNGEVLLVQYIFGGKTNRCHPKVGPLELLWPTWTRARLTARSLRRLHRRLARRSSRRLCGWLL